MLITRSRVSGALLLTLLCALAARADIPVLQPFISPVTPEVLILNSVAMAPLSLFSMLPGVTAADGKLPGTYLITRGEHTLLCARQNTTAFRDGKPITLPAAPVERYAEIYLPLQACAEALGGTATLDAQQQSASLSLPGMDQPRELPVRVVSLRTTSDAPFRDAPPSRNPYPLTTFYLMKIDGTGLCRVSADFVPGQILPALSADGKALAYADRTRLYLRKAEVAQPIIIANAPQGEVINPQTVQISHDGTTILYQTADTSQAWVIDMKIRLIASDGTNPRVLAEGSGACLSPDGKMVAYVRNGPLPPVRNPTTHLISADGHDQRTLGTGSLPLFSPDGTQLLWSQNYPPDDNSPIQLPVRYILHGEGAGTLVEVPAEERTGYETQARFSPDGQRIVFHRSGKGIFISNLARTEIRQLTSGTQDYTPAFTPDGTRILFLRNQTLYSVPVTGGEPQLLLKGFGVSIFSITPDGQHVLFFGQR